MIRSRTLILLAIVFIIIFSFQEYYLPYTLIPPVPTTPKIALTPPQPIPETTYIPKDIKVTSIPEVKPAPVITEQKPLILRNILFNGTKNINHYRYEVYLAEYPYIMDVSADSTLIRYKKDRFYVPNLLVERVFLNHTTKSATATCITDWRCSKSGSYFETIPVSYDLFNIPTIYNLLEQYLDLEVVENNKFAHMARKSVSRAKLSNGYSVLYLTDSKFPTQIMNEKDRPIFSSTAIVINAKQDLNLFSYTRRDPSTNVFFP